MRYLASTIPRARSALCWRKGAWSSNSLNSYPRSVGKEYIGGTSCRSDMEIAVAPGVNICQIFSGGSLGASHEPARSRANVSIRPVASSTKYSSCARGPVRMSWRSPRSQVVTMKVLFSNLSTTESENFPSSLLDKVKMRLGFKEKVETPVTKEEVDEKVREDNEMNQEIGGKLEREVARTRSATLEREKEDDEIASLERDEVHPEVVWGQQEKDKKAEEEKKPVLTSPGFSFSAAGLLFPYHLGVCQCLMENGHLTDTTPLAGSSAGALVCAVVAGGVSMSDAMLATKELSKDCRENGTAFRLGSVLRVFLENFLPEDAHLRVSGRIRVAVTQVFRSPKGLLVDKFDSKEDLINALHTSCFIPGYLAPRPVTLFRNTICVDGGLTLFMPPTAAEKTVKVCPFSAAAYGIKGIEISPDWNPKETRATNRQLLSWALEPADDDVLDQLYEVGYEDASVYVNRLSSLTK
ncbi:hypothetical protein MPTK1_4g20660 [Marchantia polymorpha subsp. ruderalis]|uniref:Patatin n=2 Tax=Marchantia polymorpha TaxID=3197 RepID=A0AAF6BC17_MARPO|nr:hypothetical protein MARPO_0101s0012 [Marchantia polymorpha]BBN09551.1 hypothetical protein Mp_4g20660 [Marchantia polymorpha subsp. ruderalis]|eukprot:PTQ32208.1 hypothetical protein MARPO_0101s0012 [Marchantia polymorpha]